MKADKIIHQNIGAGHLAPSYVAETVRKHAPKFGIRPSKITPLH